ncbi:hypothetical protein HQ590_13705 [bacterium]|nr:hypothetical protein [bacterium]
MVRTGFNSPLTSSAGRLFDAVAALLGLCDCVSYEAQAAIRLEHAADPRITDAYRFALRTESAPWTLDFGDAIQGVIRDRDGGTGRGVIAARFHNTVADAVVAVCRLVREERGVEQVALSGGVWQNAWLLGRATRDLQGNGFVVCTNQLVPPNDGGLALGQAAVVAAQNECGVEASSTNTSTSSSRREQPCV